MQKNLKSIGSRLSRQQTKEIKGGLSVSCRSVNGVRSCTIRCANGRTFNISGCSSCSGSSSSVNGVLTETATCCGTTYVC